ncbi:hypothetical protein KSP39_PZI016079 [Platanthera zijinensis]|uniref:Integrase catalytic domain-containing protein n=1 Tax=Platanthera zijinensis TaxID=2320716 RepID=A0AAP0B7J3_9ASPA
MGDSATSITQTPVPSGDSTNTFPSNARLATTILTSSNFQLWKKGVTMSLAGIRRTHHLTRLPTHAVGSAEYDDWYSDDCRIFALLLSSMDPSVQQMCKNCDSTKELWDTLHMMFSQANNLSRLGELFPKMAELRQGARPVTEYFAEWKVLADEILDLWEIPSTREGHQAQREHLVLIWLLNGLDPNFSTTRTEMLASPSTLQTASVYHRLTKAGSASSPAALHVSSSESIALASRGGRGNSRGGRSGSGRGREIDTRHCTHCGRRGHTKDTCWLVHGKPDWAVKSASSSPRSAHVADSTPATPGPRTVQISEEEYRRMQAFPISSPPHSAAVAQTIPPHSACTSQRPVQWLADSGASDHLTSSSGILHSYHPHCGSSITVADGSTVPIVGFGSCNVTPDMPLSSVAHVPQSAYNLLSISKLTRDLNCTAIFTSSGCIFQEQSTSRIIGRGKLRGGVYVLDEVSHIACSAASAKLLDLHYRHGHPSMQVMRRLYPEFGNVSHLSCESCLFAKLHRVSYVPRVDVRASAPFDLLHSDVWGPCPVPTLLGHRYYVTFIDDFSRMTWVYLMKNRSELLSIFQHLWNEIFTQFSVRLKCLRTDNGREYMSQSMSSFLSDKGIIHQTSCPDTPQQNGVAERKNRHLLEVTRAILHHKQVPKHFWGDAVLTAAYLINHLPTHILQGETPYHILYPDHSGPPLSFKVFGCVCYVRDARPSVSKLDPRSLKCIFLGYSRTTKGYRCYSPELHKYIISSDVVFLESDSYRTTSSPLPTSSPDFSLDDMLVPHPDSALVSPTDMLCPLWGQVYSRRTSGRTEIPPSQPTSIIDGTTSVPQIAPAHEDLTQTEVPAALPLASPERPIALRKGSRTCQNRPLYVSSYQGLSASHTALHLTLAQYTIPSTVGDAKTHPGWMAAMHEELTALQLNNTWELVSLPPGKRAIGCKWIYSVKANADGSLARLKARLVAKGYAQTYGVDYEETFAPVAKMSSIRIVISLAATHRWPLHQLDIKNAFLHGSLEEEVYMEQPPGFVAEGERNKVCRLLASLYGLKQSPRQWFARFRSVVTKFGLTKSIKDSSLFYRNSSAGTVLLIVYVDDIVITGSDPKGITDLKAFLHSNFQTKDLGSLRYFLGIEVTDHDDSIFVSQRKYALDLLSDLGMSDCRSMDSPLEPGEKSLHAESKSFESPEKYRRVVGKLNYLTMTRPDIACAVSKVSQFMATPTISQWDSVLRIVRYIKKDPGLGISYKNHGHSNIEAYCDSDWAGCLATRKSTTGFTIFMGGNLVSWKSKKQTTVARSSAEAEYRAMSHTVAEIMWIRQTLCEIRYPVHDPSLLWCDNQAAIQIATNPVFHERTKHIEVDCHFVREKYEEGLISLSHVKTGDQVADILTKGVTGVRMNFICNKLDHVYKAIDALPLSAHPMTQFTSGVMALQWNGRRQEESRRRCDEEMQIELRKRSGLAEAVEETRLSVWRRQLVRLSTEDKEALVDSGLSDVSI